MPNLVTNFAVAAGYLVITYDSGPPRKLPIKDVLRAADIPLITYEQVTSIKALANLIVILIRTLIDNGTLGDQFLEDGDCNLDDLIEAISNMGGDYGEPDLSGSET